MPKPLFSACTNLLNFFVIDVFTDDFALFRTLTLGSGLAVHLLLALLLLAEALFGLTHHRLHDNGKEHSHRNLREIIKKNNEKKGFDQVRKGSRLHERIFFKGSYCRP